MLPGMGMERGVVGRIKSLKLRVMNQILAPVYNARVHPSPQRVAVAPGPVFAPGEASNPLQDGLGPFRC